MKKQKTQKKFVYEGLGFPVVFRSVPMIEVRGTWTPDIDYNVMQKVVLLALAHSPAELTGNQIHFIRAWFEMTKTEFGKKFGVTHAAVVKWEKTQDNAAKIGLTTQRDLRLMILDKLLRKDGDFRQAFKLIHELDFSAIAEPLIVDAPLDLVAI